MQVAFSKSDNGRHCGWIATLPKHRPVPGSVMSVGTKRPPHDLVQFAVEAGLGLQDGFWGCVARGGQFKSMGLSRRTRPGRAVVQAYRKGLDASEVIAGRQVAAWEAGEATPAGTLLDRLVAACWRLEPGMSLVVQWPTGEIMEGDLSPLR